MSNVDYRPSDKTMLYGYVRRLNDKYCSGKHAQFEVVSNSVTGYVGVELVSDRPDRGLGCVVGVAENVTYGSHRSYGGCLSELRMRERRGELAMRTRDKY